MPRHQARDARPRPVRAGADLRRCAQQQAVARTQLPAFARRLELLARFGQDGFAQGILGVGGIRFEA
jgi:hypothetical protein